MYALAAAGGNITKTVIDHIGQSFATFLYFTLATNLVCTGACSLGSLTASF